LVRQRVLSLRQQRRAAWLRLSPASVQVRAAWQPLRAQEQPPWAQLQAAWVRPRAREQQPLVQQRLWARQQEPA
jgi:hypothetical protein